MRRFGAVVILGAVGTALLVGAGCGGDDARGDGTGGSSATAGKLDVIASFYPLAEAATRIGGDHVKVVNLTPAGTEPHDLELTTDQVDALEDADVVLYLGDGFQPGVAEIADRRHGPSLDLLQTVDVASGASDALEAEEGEEGAAAQDEGDKGDKGDHHGTVDPHFWLDPQLMIEAVDAIEATLAKAAPDEADTFAANADTYETELRGLDGEMESGLAHCERQQIVTSHAAFHYLAARYGLTQLPIAGLSPETEPDPDRLAALADRIEKDHITTVFYETLVSDDVAATLAREVGVTTAVLNPIEGLTKKQISAGDDYSAAMRQNLTALKKALGCS